MGGFRDKAMKPAAIVSRLIAMLALALFAVPMVPADGAAARAGPTAESRIDLSHGVIAAHRHLLRVAVPGDDSPDHAEPGAAVPAPPATVALLLGAAESAYPRPAALSILPPARGPPAV